MPLLNILQFPDPRLKKIAAEVTTFDQELTTLVDNMFETMYETQGIGLAATQVDVHKRVIVVDVSDNKSAPLSLINPVIQHHNGTMEWEEGCLSFSGVYAKVPDRFQKIVVHFLNVQGQPQELEAEALLGVCIQHEIDHLNGITFFDHLSPLKQGLLRKKLDKIRRRAL